MPVYLKGLCDLVSTKCLVYKTSALFVQRLKPPAPAGPATPLILAHPGVHPILFPRHSFPFHPPLSESHYSPCPSSYNPGGTETANAEDLLL